MEIENKMSLTLVIDFDGTCVTHEFPKIGKDINAVPVLKRIVDNGHNLILFTMRSDRPKGGDTGDSTIVDVTGNFLTDAVNWFKTNNIELYGINENPTQKKWTQSPKVYGHLYIDDTALGCPLIVDKKLCDKPFVNWKLVEIELEKMGILK